MVQMQHLGASRYKPLLRRIGTIAVVGSLFFFFTALITYPLITKFTTSAPGIGDVFIYMWTLWWFAYALVFRRQFPLFTDLMFYPMPINIAQDISVVHGLMALPVSIWGGPVAAYNFIIFLTFVLTGIGFYLFLRLITRNFLAAFIGSFIFTFSYYRIFRALVGHLDLASTEWYGFALYFLSLVFIYQKRERKNYIWAAVFMALSAYTEYRSFFYFMVFSGVFVVASVISRILVDKSCRTLSYLYEEVLSYASILLPVFVFIIPLIVVNLTKTYDVQFAPTFPEFNAVIPAYILPPCGILLSSVFSWCFSSTSWEGRVVYLGIVPIVLSVIFFLLRKDKQDRLFGYIFGICFFIFILLSLGTQTPVYSWLFEHVSLFRVMRVPSRFIIVAEISIAVFTALLLQKFFAEVTKPLIKYAAAVLLLGLLIIEAVPTDMKTVNIQAIPQEHLKVIVPGNNYAILEVPFGFRGNIYETFGSHKNDISFFYQMIHHTPIIGGYMSMIDQETWRYMYQNQLIKKLTLCQDTGRCDELDDKDREDFSSVFRIRYVIFLDAAYKPLEQYLVKGFSLRLLYQQGIISVWENPSLTR